MRWSYKTVHYELKKEGLLGSAFLDESEMELSLNEYGKAGWELVSIIENMDGLVAVFKQPLSLESDFRFPVEQEEKQMVPPRIHAREDDYIETGVESVEKSPDRYTFADKGVFAEETESDTTKSKRHESNQQDVGDIRIE